MLVAGGRGPPGGVQVSILACALVAGLSVPAVPSEVAYFPGEYYATRGRFAVERRVLETWPGPGGLRELWGRKDLDEDQKVALLLGGGAFHDPSLLPVLMEATQDEARRVRQAAVFGYRVLLGDVPQVDPPAGGDELERTREEMQAVAAALRQESLVEVWLDSLLVADGVSLTSGRGLVFRRSAVVCRTALDQLLQPEDLPLVAEAYRRARSRSVKLVLLRLLETSTLQELVVKPKNPHTGWGDEVYRLAMERGDALADRLCGGRAWDPLAARLAAAGARGVAPHSPGAAHVWLLVLEKMPEQWWPVAARMLYRCGGPAQFPSFSDPGSAASRAARQRILEFYGIRKARRGRRPR